MPEKPDASIYHKWWCRVERRIFEREIDMPSWYYPCKFINHYATDRKSVV